MKVLTAARYTLQGVEIGFCDCEPGEIVTLGATDDCYCQRYEDEEDLEDDICECRLDREENPPFVGITSYAGTTTARVEERELSERALRTAILCGLYGPGFQATPDEIAGVFADQEVAKIRLATAPYPVGTLISAMNGITFSVDETTERSLLRRRR